MFSYFVFTILALSGFPFVLSAIPSKDWYYRSRPDLVPPRLNITVPAGPQASKGFIFIAPYPSFYPTDKGPNQPGAYIFRDDGELVWSGVGRIAGWAANFRPDVYKGKQVLRSYQGRLDLAHIRFYGNDVILDERYDVIKIVPAGRHRISSVHEFRIVKGRTVLIDTPIFRSVGLKKWGGTAEGQDWIVSAGFQELDLETGEVLFEWESLDHVDPTYTALPLSKTGEGFGFSSLDAWNYFHINSVDKDDRGAYLISARNYAAIFKIDGKTGAIIWQLGGLYNRSTFPIGDEVKFGYQHDARFVSRSTDGTSEIISFFDNAAHTSGPQIHPESRARIVEINYNQKTVRAIKTFPAPDGLVARSQGNTQVLPNGNVFVNWGQAGAISEFDGISAKVLFHAYLDSAPDGISVESYRGFRFNWTGSPSEEPAIVAVAKDGLLALYASWNGDTETTKWRFYVAAAGSKRLGSDLKPLTILGEAKRNGFETRLEVPDTGKLSTKSLIYAEAIGKAGQVLRRSKLVPVERDSERRFPEQEQRSGAAPNKVNHQWGQQSVIGRGV